MKTKRKTITEIYQIEAFDEGFKVGRAAAIATGRRGIGLSISDREYYGEIFTGIFFDAFKRGYDRGALTAFLDRD